MSAPVFVLGESGANAQAGDVVELAGAEGRHAVSVARLTPGEPLDLVDGRGLLLRARVASVQGRDVVRARIEQRVDVPAPDPVVVVVQALPKGERGTVAVETLTEVGVDVIVPWQAQRCVARWSGERAAKGRARWASVAFAAGKQSRRAWFPVVAGVASTQEIAARIAAAGAAVVLHEEADRPLVDVSLPARGEIVLVVGPEGGIAPEELAVLTAAGAVPARLGPSVLRTSTAGTVAAGIALAQTPRWK